MLLWQSVMAPPLSSGIWKVKVDAMAGMGACPGESSRGETADILCCLYRSTQWSSGGEEVCDTEVISRPLLRNFLMVGNQNTVLI